MNKLLILKSIFYQIIQCNFLDNNLNNNLSFLVEGSVVYDFNKISVGVIGQTNGYLNNIIFFGVDLYSKISNKNFNVSLLVNIFHQKSDAKWSFNALCELSELMNGLYVGISINHYENYNVCFKIAYNKKVYSKQKLNFYIKSSSNFKSSETDKNKREIINSLNKELNDIKSQLLIQEEIISRVNIAQEEKSLMQNIKTQNGKEKLLKHEKLLKEKIEFIIPLANKFAKKEKEENIGISDIKYVQEMLSTLKNDLDEENNLQLSSQEEINSRWDIIIKKNYTYRKLYIKYENIESNYKLLDKTYQIVKLKEEFNEIYYFLIELSDNLKKEGIQNKILIMLIDKVKKIIDSFSNLYF